MNQSFRSVSFRFVSLTEFTRISFGRTVKTTNSRLQALVCPRA